MTSEICVMNRHAVVLAADSATTVSRWVNGKLEERYFKGANKIFQLSNHHPVGVMIFDSADLLNVPWEIAVKEFRSELNSKSFNSLEGYASEFFDFLSKSSILFPETQRSKALITAAEAAALKQITDVDYDESAPDQIKRDAFLSSISEYIEAVETLPPSSHVDADTTERLITTHLEKVVESIESYRVVFDFMPEDVSALARAAIIDATRRPGSYFGNTGIVFAGYGDHDIFPGFIEYTANSIIDNFFIRSEEFRHSISHDVPAALKAFAQTSMSDTFTLGFSGDVYISLMVSLQNGLREFADSLCKSCGVDPPNDLDELTRLAAERVSEGWLARSNQEHSLPLRNVLGVLPIDEMAELAETLIGLQSLKEKVTKPSETVGGPIDVAVITRQEGFVWVKRKQFFDLTLNPRFSWRQQSLYA